MTFKVGDKLPEGSFTRMGESGPEAISTEELFSGKKVVLFAVPGAFTPACSDTHLPGFVVHFDAISAQGIDAIACMAVNDVFVMDAWGRAGNADNLEMLSDGNGDYTAALGLELDARVWGLGVRSKRFAMIVNDGVIELLNIDEAAVESTSAEVILSALKS
ncbi:MAG: peroxiredoxin [Cellvibrionales bacterium TMED148]|nr:peroxiredoxin [Porticoccaceae bacterium]RPG90357.1 MAG: peroxiredoxin [Cellvibrionales bacterium TMED148]|tara:strand:- start:1449 stop:1931 length:483 start_codon:yes stop_codon:yes gene_type:complete